MKRVPLKTVGRTFSEHSPLNPHAAALLSRSPNDCSPQTLLRENLPSTSSYGSLLPYFSGLFRTSASRDQVGFCYCFSKIVINIYSKSINKIQGVLRYNYSETCLLRTKVFLDNMDIFEIQVTKGLNCIHDFI